MQVQLIDQGCHQAAAQPSSPAAGVHIAGSDFVGPGLEIVFLRRAAGNPPEYLLAVVGNQLDVVVAWVRERLAAQLREPVVGRQVRIADQSPESGAPGSRV